MIQQKQLEKWHMHLISDHAMISDLVALPVISLKKSEYGVYNCFRTPVL